jgi:uncharacterized protein with HEPN domain
MAASKNPAVRLAHIRDELAWLLPRFKGISYEEFAADFVNVRAVERGLSIISEAVKALPDEMLQSYPQIEWHAVRALGNVLRHDYERVDPHRLWAILTGQLTELNDVVAKLLEEHGPLRSSNAGE